MPEWIKSVTLMMHNYGIDGFQADELHIETYPHAKTVFDAKGNVLEEISYSRNGEIESRYEHRYDDQGHLLETLYFSGEELTDRRTFELRDDGKAGREFKHYLDGSFDTITYQYNDLGQLIGKVTADEDGNIESSMVLDYSGSTLLAEKEKDGDGTLLSEKSFRYDEHGHLVEFSEWNRENESCIRTVEEYDENGLRMSTSRYRDGKLRERISYSSDDKGQVARMTEENEGGVSAYQFEYDETGNILVQEETDRQGEVISRMERTYDAGGRVLDNKVFIDGQGRRMSQYYRIEYIYEWEGEHEP